MRRRRWVRLVAVASLLALLGAACGEEGTGGAGDGESLSIRLGGVLPLTGALSDFGPAMARGAELAVEVFEEAAAAAGLDADIDLSIEDSQTDPAAAVEAARKLVDTDDVDAIVGAAASAATIAVAESVTIPGGVVQCSPASTSGDITDLADNGLVVRTPPSDEHQAPILADVVVAELGTDATVNLGARNDAYGEFLISGVETELSDRGVTIGETVLWNPDAATFDSEAAQIVSGDPDGWVLIDFPGTWQKMGPALVRTGGWDPARTFSADGLKVSNLPQSAGEEASEGLRGTAPGGTLAFNALWDERVPEQARETFDAHTFDCTMLLLLAATAAGSGDSDAVVGQLEAVSGPAGTAYTFEDLEQAVTDLLAGDEIDYEGASGPVNLDENGDPQARGATYEVYVFRDATLEVVTTETVE